jgi:hypothetical protein
MLAAKAVKFGYKWNAGNEGGGGGIVGLVHPP